MENFLTKPHISDPIRHPVSTKVFHPAEFFHYLMRISVDVMKMGLWEGLSWELNEFKLNFFRNEFFEFEILKLLKAFGKFSIVATSSRNLLNLE